jgi:hypothetical protein
VIHDTASLLRQAASFALPIFSTPKPNVQHSGEFHKKADLPYNLQAGKNTILLQEYKSSFFLEVVML